MSPLLSVAFLAATFAQIAANAGQDPVLKANPAKNAVIAAPLAGAKYVSLQFGGSFPLAIDQQGKLSTRIAVSPEKDVDFTTLLPSVLDVAAGPDHSQTLTKCFKAASDTDPSAMPAIVVTYECSALAPATYTVTIGLAQQTKAGVQKIGVEVKRAPTEIRTISALIIERVTTFPCRTPAVAPNELIVTSSAAKLPLTDVSAGRVDPIVSGDRPTGAELKFTPALKADTNGNASLPLVLSGEMPYGKAKTTVRVTANELAAPVYVPVEIRTRFHEWFLALFILIGLFLGWVMRTFLAGMIERGNARLIMYDLADKIEVAGSTARDATFRGKIGNIPQDLRGASAGDAKKITAAITKADTDFQGAVSDLNERLRIASVAVAAATELVANQDDVPIAIRDVLKEAEEHVKAGRNSVAVGDADSANAALLAAGTTLKGVIEKGQGWVDNVMPHISDAGSMNPLTPEYEASFKASLAKLKTQVQAIPLSSSATPEQVLPLLRTAFGTIHHEIETQEVASLKGTVEVVVGELKKKPIDTAAIDHAATALSNALVADVDATLAPLKTADALLKVIGDTLTKAAPGDSGLVEELKAGRYVEAARRVVSGPMLGVKHAPLVMFVPTPPVVGERQRAAMISPPAVAQHMSTVIPRKRTLTELISLKAAQFIIASVGIVLVGSLILMPAFDGTWRGLLTGLFWGYAGDISVDALTEAAKKVRA